MSENRRHFLRKTLAGGAVIATASLSGAGRGERKLRKVPVGLVQFDTVPEQPDKNLSAMERLAEKAVASGARWVMFHESSVCDYTARLDELAEAVPEGKSTRRMEKLARSLGCYICFGHSEKELAKGNNRFYITQVFVGPKGFFYKYRKTWIWRDRDGEDRGYRNEWARYDVGDGPELFDIEGVKATCFICADGEAPRCIQRAAELKPELVFYPQNRGTLGSFERFGVRAKAIAAPMLVTNRVGRSWLSDTMGGCVVYSSTGEVLAKANREGREEILFHELEVGSSPGGAQTSSA